MSWNNIDLLKDKHGREYETYLALASESLFKLSFDRLFAESKHNTHTHNTM